MNKKIKAFLILIMALFISFGGALGYTKYQEHKRQKELEKAIGDFKNIFSLDTSENKKEVKKENIQEIKETESLNKIKYKNFIEENISKNLFDKGFNLEKDDREIFEKIKSFFKREKVSVYKNINENIKYILFSQKNRLLIQEIELNKNFIKSIREYESKDNFATYKARLTKDFVENKAGYVDVRDTAEKKGITEMSDGTRIEYTVDESGNQNGPAIEYSPNGNKEEFEYAYGLKSGKAVKYYENGDIEEFYYSNGLKSGKSVYKFKDGDMEEAIYKNDKLNGKAKYTFADGFIEIYNYKDGVRVD